MLQHETAPLVRDRQAVVSASKVRPGDEEVLAFAFAEAAARDTDLIALHAWQDVVVETAFSSIGPLIDWDRVAADEERVLAGATLGWLPWTCAWSSNRGEDLAEQIIAVPTAPTSRADGGHGPGR